MKRITPHSSYSGC